MKHLKIIPAVLALAGLVACNGKNDGPSTVTKLDVPTGVEMTAAGETSLSFKWDAVSGAESYEWRLKAGSAEAITGTSGSTSVTVSSLSKGTEYNFFVRAKAGEIVSGYSYAVTGRTSGTADPETPDDPDDPDTPEDPGTPVSDAVYAEFMIPSVEEDGVARAFPGAEGGGMYTTGGRGGKVLHVTNLKDDGSEGTLRWAVNQSGARTIVFDVAGIIELQSDLRIQRGDLTIAGQTAPGDGICLKNYTTNVAADNVIIRYMRFRLGDEAPWTSAQIEAGSADGEDAIWGRYHDNIILDHCSMSWSVDECASFYGNENFTMQWCMIAESMKNCKLHTKGNHGYGGLWGGKNASFHHNVLAHHDSRNARIDHPHIYENHKNPARRGNVDLRNNVIYDWGDNSTYGGEGGHFNLVNNYYKKGPSSKDRKYFVDAYGMYTSKCSTCNASNIDDGYPELYLDGNMYAQYASTENGPAGVYWHNGSGHANYNVTASSPLAIFGREGGKAYTTTHTAAQACELVSVYAGASLARDAVDTRIGNDIKNGTGRIINDISDVKTAYGSAWPAYNATEEQKNAVRDSDADGMPDWFEEQFGLKKSDASDGAQILLDKNGRYTNLEMYLHYLVRELLAAQNSEGEYKEL